VPHYITSNLVSQAAECPSIATSTSSRQVLVQVSTALAGAGQWREPHVVPLALEAPIRTDHIADFDPSRQPACPAQQASSHLDLYQPTPTCAPRLRRLLSRRASQQRNFRGPIHSFDFRNSPAWRPVSVPPGEKNFNLSIRPVLVDAPTDARVRSRLISLCGAPLAALSRPIIVYSVLIRLRATHI
jgi:hypothetical protein